MDLTLHELRQSLHEAQNKFTERQKAYIQALAENRSQAEIRLAIDACLAEAEPYSTALETHRNYLSRLPKSTEVEVELDQNGKYIDILMKETEDLAKLASLQSTQTEGG
jgi:hypothetical protein